MFNVSLKKALIFVKVKSLVISRKRGFCTAFFIIMLNFWVQ